MLRRLKKDYPNSYIAVIFDDKGKTFRDDIYPEYKANRDPAPPELKQQFDRCREITRAFGLQEFAEERFEADDIKEAPLVRLLEAAKQAANVNGLTP